jgi:hypothetical protein
MKIGRSDGNIAQAWYAEDLTITFQMGNSVPAKVGIGFLPARERVSENAEFLEQIATEILSLMTGDAAVGLEELIPALLIGRNRLLRTAEIVIEWSIGRYQGALESSERVEH